MCKKNLQKQSPDVFYKKRIHKNFAKFTAKYLCRSLFFDKDSGLQPAALLQKRLRHKCFSVNFAKY